MKKTIKTAEELSELSGKTKRAIYKNKNLPYDDSEGQRLYDISDPLIKKWLKGESIRPQKKPAKKKTVKKSSKKKAVKSTYDKLKDKLPDNEHDLLNELVKKFPGIENGMLEAAKKIEKKENPKKQKTGPKKNIIPAGFEIDEHLKELTDSGQLSFAAAMGLTKRDLEKIKIYEQIKDIKTKSEERREGLIPRKLVKTVFGKIYEIDMNQYIPMKEKLIPDLAAIFGVTDEKLKLKAGKKIDDELWKILSNVKRELNKFLNTIGEGDIG